MKKTLQFTFKLLFVAVATVAFFSCEKDDTVEPKLFLETDTVEVSNEGGEYTVDVLSNMPWNVEADADWVSFDQGSAEKGRVKLAFSVAENDDDERTALITVLYAATTQQIRIIQEAGNRDDIYVKVGGTGEGFSWEDATSLNNALQLAVTGNTIHIAEGTYVPSQRVTGGDPADNGDITFEIKTNITLKGGYPASATEGTAADPAQYATILSGALEGGGNAYHVVTVSAPKLDGQKVVLEGLTISHGKASASGTSVTINGIAFRRDYGGGIAIGSSVIDIRNSQIINNNSDKYVAGLYAFEGSEVTIENCKINNNISVGNVGGLWIRSSTAYIFNSEIIANEGGTAAGVHAFPDAQIYMYNSVVANNTGRSYGAGFYVRERSTGLVVNSVISGNTSTSSNGGGGIMMYNNSDMTIVNSTITENNIQGPGGGVYRRLGDNTLTIYNSVISGNIQKDGGPDVDAYEIDAVAPVIKASITGIKVYDAGGNVMADATFDHATMLSEVSPLVFLPVGDANPATLYGMTVSELITLGSTFSPSVGEAIIAYDKLTHTRSGLQVMGAYVAGD